MSSIREKLLSNSTNDYSSIRSRLGLKEEKFYKKNISKSEINNQNTNSSSMRFLKKSNTFADGYQIGDVTKTALSTVGDIAANLGKGFLNTVEGVTDSGQYLLADVAKGLSKAKILDVWDKNAREWLKEKADALEENAKFDSTGAIFGDNEKKSDNLFKKGWSEELDKNSVSGTMFDSVAQGVGNVAAMAGTGYLGGSMLGIGSTATSFLNSFSSAFGNAKSEAYKNGADDKTAFETATVSGFAEAISEQFFDALPGMKVEGWGSKLTGKIGNVVSKHFGTKAGKLTLKALDSVGEGAEEVISNALSAIGNDIVHYVDSDYNYGMEEQTGNVFKDTKNAIFSNDTLASFISASLTSAIINGGNTFITEKQKKNIITAYAKDNNMSYEDAKKMFNSVVDANTNSQIEENTNFNDKIDIENEETRKLLTSIKNGDVNLKNYVNSITSQINEYEALKKQNKLTSEQEIELNEIKNQLSAIQNQNTGTSTSIKEEVNLPTVQDIVNQEKSSQRGINLPVYNQQSNINNSDKAILPTVNDFNSSDINMPTSDIKADMVKISPEILNDIKGFKLGDPSIESYKGSYIKTMLNEVGIKVPTAMNYVSEVRPDMSFTTTKDLTRQQYDSIGNALQKLRSVDVTSVNNANYSIPIGNYQYVKSSNANINELRRTASVYLNNTARSNNTIRLLENIIKDRNYIIRFNPNITNEQGVPVNGLITKENGKTIIELNPNADNYVEFLVVHEITHDIATKEMKELILDYSKQDPEFEKSLESLKERYKINDVSDEVVADVCGELFGNREFIQSVVEKKPNIFKKILNNIRKLAEKIKGTGANEYVSFVEKLKTMWEDAYYSNRSDLKDKMFSIQQDSKGNKYVEVDTDQDIFEGVDEKDYNKIAKMYITDYLMGNTTLATDGNAIIDSRSVRKYTNPGDRQRYFTEKMKLSPELKNVLAISEKISESLPTKENTKYSKWEYYKINFKINDQIFTGKVNIGVDTGGRKHFYEVNNIKKASGISGISPNYPTGFSANNIPQSSNNVNSTSSTTKYSIPINKNNAQELGNSSFSLEQRVSGDKLLDTQDLIEEIKTVGAKVDKNGYVTLYHQTTNENADKIKQSGKMFAKEPYVYFSTSENASQSDGRGNTKLEFKIPAEKLILDDIFDDNADVKIKLNSNKELDVSDYIISKNRNSASNNHKQKQLDIVKNNNPVNDDYHTWIRNVEDIKTLEETINDSDWIDYDEYNPDLSRQDIENAIDSGKITVYSSYPIKQGIFVSPSKMEAESYSSNGKVYSKEVNINDVAWIDPTQGQYAKVYDVLPTKYSQSTKEWNEYLKDNFPSAGTKTKMSDIKLPVREDTESSSKKSKILNPSEIAKLTKEDANTTPILPAKASTNKVNDGNSHFAKNIKDKVNMLNAEQKAEILSKEDVRYYDKVTNKESLEKAFKRLNDGGKAEVTRWFNNNENIDSSDVAEGYILLKQYSDKAENAINLAEKDYYNEMVVETAKKMRKLGTTAGQIVQAFNIMERMTPEGMVKYAQSELSEAYDRMIKNKSKEWIDKHREDFDLKPNEVQFIMDNMQEVQNMEDGYDKRVKLAEIQKLMTDKLPPKKGAKIKSWMRISMLFNPKTQVRNVAGNALIMPINSFGDLFSSYADKLIAKKTGVRTTGNTNIKAMLKGIKKGAYEATNDYKKGINTKDMEGNRFEISDGKSFSEKNLMGRTLNRTESLLNYVMDVGDRVFSEAAFENSLQNQLVLNNTTEITQEMIDIAHQEALSRTWNDNNNYTRFVLNARAGLNQFANIRGYGLGDVLIPFAKTPANLTKAIVDYSPAGLVSAINKGINLKRSLTNGQYTATMQHEFVQSLGKATAGTMLYILGIALALSGITSGDSDDDKDTANFLKNTLGINSYSIKIGGKSFTYDWAQPLAAPLSITANVVNSKSGDSKALLEGIVGSLDSAGSILLEQSFLQSINDVLNDNDGVVSGIINEVLELPARAVPTFSKQIADLVDGTQRTSFEYGKPVQSAINSIKAKIPFVSKTLSPSVDTLGREIQKYGGKNNIFNVFLNPANVSTENISESAEEIYRLYKETGDQTIMPRVAPYYINKNGEKITMASKEKVEYQKISGKIIEDNVQLLLKDNSYKEMNDTEKTEVINKIINYSYNKAREEVLDIEMSNEYNKINSYVNDGGKVANYYLNKKEIDYSYTNPSKYKVITQITTYNNYLSYKKNLDEIKDNYTNTSQRKAAIIKYVNSLNLTIPQKAMLIKMNYSSYNDYNNQIINYINSQKLSMSEKQEILEQLGFKVRNGRVYTK